MTVAYTGGGGSSLQVFVYPKGMGHHFFQIQQEGEGVRVFFVRCFARSNGPPSVEIIIGPAGP